VPQGSVPPGPPPGRRAGGRGGPVRGGAGGEDKDCRDTIIPVTQAPVSHERRSRRAPSRRRSPRAAIPGGAPRGQPSPAAALTLWRRPPPRPSRRARPSVGPRLPGEEREGRFLRGTQPSHPAPSAAAGRWPAGLVARFRRRGSGGRAAWSSVRRGRGRPWSPPRHSHCASVFRWRYFQRYRWKYRQRIRPSSTMPPAGHVRGARTSTLKPPSRRARGKDSSAALVSTGRESRAREGSWPKGRSRSSSSRAGGRGGSRGLARAAQAGARLAAEAAARHHRPFGARRSGG